MTGLTIGGKHTYDDFGLRMLSFNVSFPKVYEEIINIPGKNGPLDMSEALTGEPIYQERKLSSKYDLYEPKLELRVRRISELSNYINGKYLQIIDDKCPEYYYEGRITVDSKQKNALFHEVTISADVNPFKLKNNKTIISADVSGEETVICPNLRMSTVPEITVDSAFTVVFGDVTLDMKAGTHIFPDIKFVEGDNEILCTGNGTIIFTYQEGSL